MSYLFLNDFYVFYLHLRYTIIPGDEMMPYSISNILQHHVLTFGLPPSPCPALFHHHVPLVCSHHAACCYCQPEHCNVCFWYTPPSVQRLPHGPDRDQRLHQVGTQPPPVSIYTWLIH